MKTPPAFACLFSCACMSLLPAQTAPAPQTPESEEENIVQLDTYNVVSGEGTGYDAVDTITGARQATLLRELPFTVNVVMGDFMEDFALFDLGEQLAFVSSFTPDDGEGESYYSLRGFGQTTLLKNGFRRGGLIDRINVSRMEVIKGPSAAMYGQTEPGGMVNTITYKPKAKKELYLSLMAGAYNTQRAEFRMTGNLARWAPGETNYLVSASTNQREYEQQYRSWDQKSAVIALSHKFKNSTLANVEVGRVTQNRRGEAPIPWLVGNTARSVYAPSGNRYEYTSGNTYYGHAWSLFNFNMRGPNAFVKRENDYIEGSVEHRLGQVWSLRAAGHYADRDYWRLYHTGDRYQPQTDIIINRRANWHVLEQISRDAQIDLMGHWRVKDTEHRFLLTFDYNYLRGISTTWRGPSAVPDIPASQRNLSVSNPDYTLPPFSPDYYTFGDDVGYNRKTSVYGTLARYQLSAMQGRLIVLAGARFDYIDFEGYTWRGVREPEPKSKAVSPQIGINYKLTPQHTLFANYSKSFKPFSPDTGTIGDEDSTEEETRAVQFDNETGASYEAGIKSFFFDERLRITASVFSIEKTGMKTKDVAYIEYDEPRPIYNDDEEIIGYESGRSATVDRTNGIIKADGIEMDFYYKYGKQVEMLGQWSYSNPRYTYTGNDTDLLGRLPQRVANMTSSAAISYTFDSGPLKDIKVNASVRYIGYTYSTISTSVPRDPVTLQNLLKDGDYMTFNDGRRDIRTPAYTLVDLGATYMWRMGKFRHRVRLNVKNLLNEKYLTTSGYPGDRLGVYFSYTLRY